MSTAAPTQPISLHGRQYRAVREGAASILAPYRATSASAGTTTNGKKPRNNDEGDQAVFYNPIQQFNRDLSVLAILIYGEGAVVRKQERFDVRSLKRTNQRRKGNDINPTTTTANGPLDDEEKLKDAVNSGLKRKVSDVVLGDDGGVEEAPKRRRMSGFNTDDDDLEVRELAAGMEASAEAQKSIDSGHPVQEVYTTNTADHPTGPKISSSSLTASPLPKRHGTAFTILDALSATGLRALRYAKEIPFATSIIANDLSAEAVKSIDLNIEHNGVGEIVHSNVGDARSFMYSKVGNEQRPAAGKYVHRFDVVDLDPYGTAAPFFDAALQSLQDGGLLCVTCTDAGVFASNGYPEKAYALYGGLPLKGSHSHEGGLRLLLHAVAMSASKYGIAIEPLLSLSIDFYARLFIRIHKQPKDVKLLAGTSMIVYACDHGCGAWTTQPIARHTVKEDKTGSPFFKYGYAQAPNVMPNCEHCGFRTHLGGPVWAGPIHNPFFIQRILDRLPSLDRQVYNTIDRIEGMLTVALEEDLTLSGTNTPAAHHNGDQSKVATTPPDPRIIPRLPSDVVDSTPFFFIPNYAAKVLHAATPRENEVRGALRHLGYLVTRSHCKPGSLKTNAPWSVIWEIYREWVRTKKPVKEGAIKVDSPGWRIMGRARGTELQKMKALGQDLAEKVGKCATKDEMKTVLESAMYRLEHDIGTNAQQSSDDIQEAAGPAKSDLSKLEIVFDEELGKEKARKKLVRYQINPRANWGPMNRAGGGGGGGGAI